MALALRVALLIDDIYTGIPSIYERHCLEYNHGVFRMMIVRQSVHMFRRVLPNSRVVPLWRAAFLRRIFSFLTMRLNRLPRECAAFCHDFRSESVRTPVDPDHPTLLEAQQFPFYLSDIKPAIDKDMAAIDRPEMRGKCDLRIFILMPLYIPRRCYIGAQA